MTGHWLTRGYRRGFPAPGLTGLVALLALVSSGCLHRHKRPPIATRRVPPPSYPPSRTRPTTPPATIAQGEEGLASWYGHPYHGRRTASGEIYNMYDITAAHRTLPFGTEVRVHNLKNGQDVTVRINDRGPFVEGRIIDLSYAAAQAIHMPGLAPVRLEILSLTGAEIEKGIFGVQVGAFRERANADRLKATLSRRFGPVILVGYDRGDGYFYRVRVGHEKTEEAARQLARDLRAANLASETFVVRLD